MRIMNINISRGKSKISDILMYQSKQISQRYSAMKDLKLFHFIEKIVSLYSYLYLTFAYVYSIEILNHNFAYLCFKNRRDTLFQG